MFDTSIKGSITAAVDDGAEKPGLIETLDATTDALPEDTAGAAEQTILVQCSANDDAAGVIDLGDAAIITKTAPVPTASTDNSGLPPSEVIDDHAISCLTLIPGEFLTGTEDGDILIGGALPDVISGLDGDDVLRGRGSLDQIFGGGGDDSIMGNSGEDFLKGDGGDDVIRAGKGNDFVLGGSGADLIKGGGGADRLKGGNGDDTINGRTGDDILRGGNGADVFQFRASDRNDKILDFEQGQDRIEILNGADAFTDLSIEQDGAHVVIGFGKGQITIILDDAAAFDASDFIF